MQFQGIKLVINFTIANFVNLMFVDPTMVASLLKDFKMLSVVMIMQDFKKSTLNDSLLCDDYKEIQVVKNRE